MDLSRIHSLSTTLFHASTSRLTLGGGFGSLIASGDLRLASAGAVLGGIAKIAGPKVLRHFKDAAQENEVRPPSPGIEKIQQPCLIPD